MKVGPYKFVIGKGRWAEEIRYFTTELNRKYWSRFRPLKAQEIVGIERDVGRRLPDDMKEFLGVFGCGSFPDPFGGNIYEPDEFAAGCHGHLWMILGSSDWATADDQKQFYVTRGEFNPAPDKYTKQALLLVGVNLLDLLQIGSNGMCCYHQVYVGNTPGPIAYCLLTPESTLEDPAPSFSEGLKTILTHHWFWDEPPETETPIEFEPFEPR